MQFSVESYWTTGYYGCIVLGCITLQYIIYHFTIRYYIVYSYHLIAYHLISYHTISQHVILKNSILYCYPMHEDAGEGHCAIFRPVFCTDAFRYIHMFYVERGFIYCIYRQQHNPKPQYLSSFHARQGGWPGSFVVAGDAPELLRKAEDTPESRVQGLEVEEVQCLGLKVQG